jgi:hypothetical protein
MFGFIFVAVGHSEPLDTVASGGLYHERLMIDESRAVFLNLCETAVR